MKNRVDWTVTKSKTNLLDLSGNVCYDRLLTVGSSCAFGNYPDDAEAYHLVSAFYNIDPHNIAIGYGSCELILRILQAFKNLSLSIVTPTWQLAELYPEHLGMTYNIYPAPADMLYVANPNGITGEVLNKTQIINLLSKYQLVIVDEAYGDFSNQSLVNEAPKFNNLIVVKTLSKTIAAPGLRFGYCFANSGLIKKIQNIRPGYVTTSSTVDALKDLLPKISAHLARMIETRNYIENKYDTIKSQGNFVLFKNEEKIPVKMKQVGNAYRMALTDLETFKKLENEN
jgi:histidinol-phosphate aminotransferase